MHRSLGAPEQGREKAGPETEGRSGATYQAGESSSVRRAGGLPYRGIATKHIGYLHREIAARYARDIELSGGVLPAIVQIEQLRDDEDGHLFLNGMVQILWDGTE